MTTRWMTGCLGLLAAGFVFYAADSGTSGGRATAADPEETPIVHNVYFKLKDGSPAKVDALVAACNKYLRPQPGVVFFACGSLSELDRPVNDRDWDVGLHVVFKNRAAHDVYQQDAMHLKFIEENKENWDKVRVFDTVGK